jgi:hypothetical protein
MTNEVIRIIGLSIGDGGEAERVGADLKVLSSEMDPVEIRLIR